MPYSYVVSNVGLPPPPQKKKEKKEKDRQAHNKHENSIYFKHQIL